ncbi:MAG: hypothetical protein EX271_03115 [Acidimicrobiales bacterium]|nr:MAG: hypothetical protein EX271_03115 [Acidimicrobiales bacterium]
MQEDTEEKMFKDLLSDYAQPAKDNGFSEFVLATLPQPQSHKRLKSFMVGGAGALGGVIALTQLKGLWTYASGVKIPKLPAIETPSMEIGTLANSSLMSSSYGPLILGLGMLLTLWIAQVLIFGDGV